MENAHPDRERTGDGALRVHELGGEEVYHPGARGPVSQSILFLTWTIKRQHPPGWNPPAASKLPFAGLVCWGEPPQARWCFPVIVFRGAMPWSTRRGTTSTGLSIWGAPK